MGWKLNVLFKHVVFVLLTIFCGVSALCQVQFSLDTTAGCAPLQVQVSNTTVGATSYRWTYGSPSDTLSTEVKKDTTLLFNEGGIYVLSLEAWNGTTFLGTYQDTVAVQGVDFQFDRDLVCTLDTLAFDANWAFDFYINFGDGKIAQRSDYVAGKPILHTYKEVGVYTPLLTYLDFCGTDTTLLDTVDVRFEDWILVTPDLIMEPETVCPGEEMYLSTVQSYNFITWVFEDGSYTVGPWARKAFDEAGEFELHVELFNGCQADSDFEATISVVEDKLLKVEMASYAVPDTVCVEEVFEGVMGNEHDGLLYTWNIAQDAVYSQNRFFHAFTDTGKYPLELHIQNACGSDTTIYDTVVASSSFMPLENQHFIYPEEVCLTDSFSFMLPAVGTDFQVDFGDGTVHSTGSLDTVDFDGIEYPMQVIDHAYAVTGDYSIQVTATNACGQSKLFVLSCKVDSLQGTALQLYAVDMEEHCLGEEALFYAAGAPRIEWDFGDGSTPVSYGGEFVGHAFEYGFEEGIVRKVMAKGLSSCSIDQTAEIYYSFDGTVLELLVSSEDANCGKSDGKGVVSILQGTAPYKVFWSSGDTLQIADSLSAGDYVVTVVDGNGCKTEAAVKVNDADGPNILLQNKSDVTCFGGSDGSLSVNISGGNPPYEIQWSNNATGTSLTQLTEGKYEITVRDAGGCVSSEIYEVKQEYGVLIDFVSSPTICGGQSGSLEVFVHGNEAPYSFQWDIGDNTQELTNKPAGAYPVTIGDRNGCTFEAVGYIPNIGAPIVVVDSIVPLSCPDGEGSVYIHAKGGVLPLSYAWSDQSSNQNLLNASEGKYSVEVSDASGCKSFAQFELTQGQPEEQSICLVTVDTSTHTNKVVWSKEGLTDVDHFNVYRETFQNGVYAKIGEVPYADLSVFTDSTANPHVRAYRYKLSVTNTCGTESNQSAAHKTIHLASSLGVNGEVNLIWNAYEGFFYSTFWVWRYTDVNGWEQLAGLSSNLNSYTDVNVPVSATEVSYLVTVDAPEVCVATRGENHNSARSNRKKTTSSAGIITGIFSPGIGLNDVRVYPNPAGETCTLELLFQSDEEVEVKLYDVQAKLLLEDVVSGKTGVYKHKLVTRGLQAGVYTLTVNSANGSFVKRVLVH